LATKRDSVFTAFSSGLGPFPTPFWRENAVFAHPSWLRLGRVRVHRNNLVHRRIDDYHAMMTFADARAKVLTYLDELPEEWG